MSVLKVAVEEFTSPDPITAGVNDTYDKLSAQMKHHHIRHLPVLDAGEVVGVISDRDLRVLQLLPAKEQNILRASDIMSADPLTVNCSDSLEDVAMMMSSEKIGSVIVRDEDGEFFGIFTLTDALNALIEVMREENFA